MLVREQNMLLPGYDVAKAAQAVAYFALKSGGTINVLKLSKLIYLAEREYMRLYDEPMFYDKLVSMPDGPVASITLNLINGDAEDDTWPQFVGRRSGYDIGAAQGVTLDNLDSLSVADKEVLSRLWATFGSYGRYQLRDWTHVKENIPEWEDPRGSSSPISHDKVFRCLGKADSDALEENVEEHRRLSEALSRIP
jgi:uncharacterized phage-associated protein